ncbi:hypothetical protein DKM44_00930 [Deinococcus irradiatisoli]|uniref:GGDEF domain-containing protein n=1 Tax=Deinococcus irradiatisoli TaxID=2202254 RepID=A0A2Z3JA37_9DEIO|nr:GGDEF domain-containing protein [Deinococcus irradiatisoli]AWN21977.1 hypothetical protein DKM44_00930 [Deinococcus irradiatisoli]
MPPVDAAPAATSRTATAAVAAPDRLRRRVYLGATVLGSGVLIGSWIINLQSLRSDPYISIGHPILLAQCLWIMVWLLQGRALHVAERVVFTVNATALLTQLLLAPLNADGQIIGLASAAYWMLVAISILSFLIFNSRQALWLCAGMYTLAVALPWGILLARGAGLGASADLGRVQLTCGAVLALLSVLAWYKERFAAEQGRRQLFEHLAYTDPLTQLPNRHALYVEIDRLLTAGGERRGSLILLDIDHFKRINDGFGHTVGDRVLGEVAACLRREVPAHGCVGRWGGEEFLITLPGCSPAEGQAVAERLRRALAHGVFSQVGSVTASFGVTSCQAGDDLHHLTGRADRALYTAKASGRNRVVVAGAGLSEHPVAPPTEVAPALAGQ